MYGEVGVIPSDWTGFEGEAATQAAYWSASCDQRVSPPPSASPQLSTTTPAAVAWRVTIGFALGVRKVVVMLVRERPSNSVTLARSAAPAASGQVPLVVEHWPWQGLAT